MMRLFYLLISQKFSEDILLLLGVLNGIANFLIRKRVHKTEVARIVQSEDLLNACRWTTGSTQVKRSNHMPAFHPCPLVQAFCLSSFSGEISSVKLHSKLLSHWTVCFAYFQQNWIGSPKANASKHVATHVSCQNNVTYNSLVRDPKIMLPRPNSKWGTERKQQLLKSILISSGVQLRVPWQNQAFLDLGELPMPCSNWLAKLLIMVWTASNFCSLLSILPM